MQKNKSKTLFIIFLIIFGLNLFIGISDSIQSGQWGSVIGQVIALAGVVYIFFRLRDIFARSKEEYRKRFESSQQHVSVRDAALFSLSWSREIYRSIPEDRKQIVKQAVVLIGIGMAIVLIKTGIDDIITLIIIAALVLAGVNLLIWVFATERSDKERLQIELDTARRMQLNLMPTEDPRIVGFDISGCCIPAQDVGGDHFDYVWIGNERNMFCIALVDVAGKGMNAAMTAILTSGAFLSEIQNETDISTIMNKLNRAIRSHNNRSRFVSFFILSIDAQSKKAQYINAGQAKPLLLRNGSVSFLEHHGPHFPLGLIDDVKYQAASLQFEPFDTLMLYTDGVSEAMNAEKEILGEERLRTLFKGTCSNERSSRSIMNAIKEEALSFSHPAQQHDDLTIVIVKVLP